MTVTTPVYCTRQDVKRSLDIKETARNNWLIDQAMQSAAKNINKQMHRVFYPTNATHYWDWPNFQRAYPWRIWFDQFELCDTTVNVPVVTSGGTLIPASAILWGPWNDSPPFTFLELDRSQSYGFGVGSTPQRDVAITGTFGYQNDTDPGGTLAAAVSSTTATSITVSNGAALGVGSLLVVGSERILCQDVAFTATTQTNLSGATTALASDNAITVSDGTQITVDETILLDQERMLVVDITGDVLTVNRAWDGSALADHSAATTINAARLYTAGRAQLGTTAATYTQGTAISVFRYPALIHELSIAESVNTLLARTSGYTSQADLADLWDEAETAHARKARRRVV